MDVLNQLNQLNVTNQKLQIPFTSITITPDHLISAGLTLIFGIIAVRILSFLLLVLAKRHVKTRAGKSIVLVFLHELAITLGYVAVFLMTLSKLGYGSQIFTATVSLVIGFILGQGLQDTLSNFLAGMTIATVRPFDVGDWVEIDGVEGLVHSLGVWATELKTFDNKWVIIPNRKVWSSRIINYSKTGLIRIDIYVGVPYDSNLELVVNHLKKRLLDLPYVSRDPHPMVFVHEFGDSAIILRIMAWTQPRKYLATKSALIQFIKSSLDEIGVEIPYPQIDVHMKD